MDFLKNQHGLTFVKDFQLQTALQSPTVHAYLLFDAHTTQNWKVFEKITSSWVAECKKSGCIGCIFISDWKTTCFCRFPPKNYMRKNAYLDLKKTIKSKTNVSSIWIGRINSPANYNIWNICPSLETLHESCGNMIINSIRNMVIDFILFCWTWSTQTQQIELENKSASWIDLKASLDLKSIFEGKSLDVDRQGRHMQSQRKPVRSVLQTAWRHSALRFTTEWGFLDWTNRWKERSGCKTS